MGVDTKIQWTDHTFNPWRGCVKVSPGCANCYAEKQSHRNPAVLGEWGVNGTRAMAAESYWQNPLKWDRAAKAAGKRRRVFCASLADVFEDRPELASQRARLFRLILRTPYLDWLLLTKRPENIDRLWPVGHEFTGPGETEWPNVWLGTSVEDQQRADERIPALLQIPARVRFLSMEPLLGPVNMRSHWYTTHNWHDWLTGKTGLGRTENNFGGHWQTGQKLDWVIVGGESGPKARPLALDWVRLIRDQCKEAGVPVFVKQLGNRWYSSVTPGGLALSTASDFLAANFKKGRDPKGGDPDEWPEDLRVREFPAVTQGV